MSSKFLHYEACPRCRSNGNDNRGDNMGCYSNGSRHCFSCGYHEFPKSSAIFSINDRRLDNATKSLLPADFSREVPTRALTWLMQYGLPYSYWEKHIGYSEAHERLVFIIGTPLQFSIGRYVGTATPSPRKWFVWGESHSHCEVVLPGEATTGDSIVLVEDLISAHKVGQIATAIPLFGTRVHPCHLYYLINTDKPVILWLDKDQELNVKKQALNLGSLLGRNIKVITTDKDPKELSFENIRNECGIN